MLHSPEKKSDHVSIDTEVHLALTPLEPIVFFGFHKRMSVTGYSLSFAVFFCLLRRLIVAIYLLMFLVFHFQVLTFWFLLVVGTVEGGRPPTKIKTDLKKPIVNLACHPRLPVLVDNHIFTCLLLLIAHNNILCYHVLLFPISDIQAYDFSM